MTQPIEEYFRYHPPQSQIRSSFHDAINNAALELAKTLDACVEDQESKKMAMFAIQVAKMFANQGVMLDELNGLHRSVD